MKFKSLFIIAAILTATACQSSHVGENRKESIGNAAPGAVQVAPNSDPQAALVSSLKNLQEKQSWIAVADTASDGALGAAATKMQIKYSAPDSFEIESDAGEQKVRIVAVGGKTYLQTNGKWQQAPAGVNMGRMINNFKEMFSDQKLRAFRNVQAAGRETVDGKTLTVYTYEIDQQAAMPEEMKKEMTDEMKARLAEVQSENKARIWIDEQRNLPARMEMTMKMTNPQQITQTMSINYNFDDPVNIEAPQLK